MLATALHLIPVLAAGKSKVPFYIAGGALVVWAFFLALVVGRSRPEFPNNGAGQRAVIGITALLVVAATAMAVATSGGGA